NSIGPPLRDIADQRSLQWLQSWIKNSQALINSGDAQAVAIYNEYNQVAMPPFPQLSDADIDDILAYTSQPAQVPASKQPGEVGEGTGSGGVSTDIVLGILAFVLLMLLIILYLVNKTLRRFATASGVELPVS